jgi:ERCC4-type nuclease
MRELAMIVVDSREQAPFIFDPVRVGTIRQALPAGDYSLAGLEDRVAVERKSLDDFVATVIRGRSRFRQELKRLQAYGAACIVVEADLTDVLAGRYRNGADPASVFGAIVSIVVDYGIPVFFCSDRQVACRFTQDYLLRIHRRLQEATDAQP